MPSISKSLRFDIFRRDGFTCQYCGRKPPDAILEIDHITPSSKGGDNDPSNLVTSCYECNRGKSDKVLRQDILPRGLDLDYLEAEQRLAELSRYKEIKQKLDDAVNGTILDLQNFFAQEVQTNYVPEAQKFRWLLYYHDPDEIEKAIIFANQQSYSTSQNKWRYACAILRNWRQAKPEGEEG